MIHANSIDLSERFMVTIIQLNINIVITLYWLVLEMDPGMVNNYCVGGIDAFFCLIVDVRRIVFGTIFV